MNRAFESSPENRKSPEGPYGYNVQIDIEVARHGQKSEHNAQVIANPEETTQIGADMDISGADLVAVRTTPVPRAVQSAVLVAEGLEKNLNFTGENVNVRATQRPTGILNTEGTHIENILAHPEQVKDINRLSSHMREGYAKAVRKSIGSTLEQENAGVEYFIRLMNKDLAALAHTRQDIKEGWPSLAEEALQEVKHFKEALKLQEGSTEGNMSVLEVILRMVNHFVAHYSEVSNRSKSESKTLIYEVNHSGFIEPFLLHLLKEQMNADPIMQGDTALERFGGAFRPNESFRISLLREKKDGGITLQFVIRGKVYDLNANTVQAIVTENKQLLSYIQSYE